MSRSSAIAVLAAALAAAGCGKKKEAAATDEAKPAPPAEATPAPAPASAPAEPPAQTFDDAAFCADVFAEADVRRIMGAEVSRFETPASRRPYIGSVSCALQLRDANRMPLVTVSLKVDCRGGGKNVETWRESLRRLGTTDGGTYRDVAIGKGGGYAAVKAAKAKQIAYVDDVLPCYVHVATGLTDADHVEELAKHVKAHLTEANRPR